MFRESFLALAAIASLLGSTPVLAKETSQVALYPVMGATAAEVYAYIKTKAPRIAPNATFAYTAIATKTDKREAKAEGSCRYDRFKTSALYIFNLPHHSKLSSLPAKTARNWSAFVQYLKTHEEGHRGFWRECFAEYDAQALTLEANSCEALDRAREKLFTGIKRKCLAKDEAYDVIFRKEVQAEPFMKEALARGKDR